MQTVRFAVFYIQKSLFLFWLHGPPCPFRRIDKQLFLLYEKLGDINLNSFLLDVLNLLFNDFPFSRVLYP